MGEMLGIRASHEVVVFEDIVIRLGIDLGDSLGGSQLGFVGHLKSVTSACVLTLKRPAAHLLLATRLVPLVLLFRISQR